MGRQRFGSAEVEAKLIVEDEFEMPDFEGVIDGATSTRLPERELDAVYFDTADLELAKWGATLRHRSGEPGAAWTLKLPRTSESSVLTREELRFEGPVERIPDAAVDLVRAFTRGRAMVEVARLQTTRAPIRVSGHDGATLLEVVDDAVRVQRPDGGTHAGFREVEVEAANDNSVTRSALDRVVAKLIEAGARPSPPVPKLIRALGEQATDLPPVVIHDVDKKSSTADLIRHLIAKSAAQLVLNDAGVRLGHDAEAVHQFRVATRRLRADLRTFRFALDDVATSAMRDELNWIGGGLGPVRDLDVLGERIATNARSLPEVDRAEIVAVSDLLDRKRSLARDRALEALTSVRYDRLLETLVGFADQPPLSTSSKSAGRSATSRAGKLVRRRWKQLSAAVDAAGPEPSDEQLHRIRLAAKRCRYAADAVVPVVGRPARRFAARIEHVQGVLGDYHDSVVADAWLRDAATDAVDARLAIGGLLAIERAERERLRAEWPTVWERVDRSKLRFWR